MKSEKEDILRKLNVAKEKLPELDTELARLEALAAPLNKQIANVQAERQYILARIDKLTKMSAV
jgi:chromosome segregation ATPase